VSQVKPDEASSVVFNASVGCSTHMAKTRKNGGPAARIRDALPVLTLIVDEDLSIQGLNGAARKLLGANPEKALRMRNGEVFHCAHSQESPGGCGRARFCRICPIREAALLSWREQRVVRRRTTAEVERGHGVRPVHMLVTAVPLPSGGPVRILLVLEDIDALVDLQKRVPICASCRRVSDDPRYWDQLETHFRHHLDLELSHGVCSACSQQLYGDALGERLPRSRGSSIADRRR
jgi:hypothetical protein